MRRPAATLLSVLLAIPPLAPAALAADAPRPVRVNFTMAQSEYEVGVPVQGQLVLENTSSGWVAIPDPAEITKHLRILAGGKEVAPRAPEKFGAAKTKELGPGGFVGVNFDLSLMFPELSTPGAYSVAYRAPGSTLDPIAFRLLPAFDPAKKHRLALETPDGPVALELYAREAPVSVRNVVNLAHTGFYDGADVARIEPGVMIAIRGPVTPRHRIVPFEQNRAEYLAGTVLLEAAGADRDRVSFPNLVVLLAPAPELQGRYTVVGQVVEGMEALRKLTQRPTTGKDGAPAFKPVPPVAVTKATATSS